MSRLLLSFLLLPLFTLSQETSQNLLCDSIIVEFKSLGINYEDEYAFLELDMSTIFYSDYFFAYSGFVFVDENESIIASEVTETATNGFGFSGQYSDTRNLIFYYDINLSDEGTLNLYEGLFSGNPELACSFPFNFSVEGEIDLSGHWYADELDDYIEITADSFFIYVFEDECYELESYIYEASDSLIYLSNNGELMIMPISNLSPSSFNLNLNGQTLNVNETVFNSSDWVECSEITSILINQNYFKELTLITNILGEKVIKPTYNLPHLYFYNDGTVEKKIIIE